MLPVPMFLVYRHGNLIKSPGLVMIGLLGIVTWLLTIQCSPRLLRVVGMENGYFIVTGAGESFRRSLPSN